MMRPWIVITPDSGRQQRNMQRSVSLGMESNGAHIASTFENFQENVYHFIKILGSGAFGETVLYRKTKVNDNTLIVWKERSLAHCSEENKQNVLAQLDMLSWMQHANVVSYSNFFIEEQCLYMEVEYANGGTLHEKIGIQDNLFGEEMVIWYFFQILSSVDYIHRQKVLHRDIQSANIFLTKSGLVKLGDFGILHVSAEECFTHNDLGTPYNSSPEFLTGKQFSAFCDLWAIGCVLYELLTLRSVYEGMIDAAVDENILKKNINSVSPNYSSEMKSLLYELLNMVPEKRPSASKILSSSIFSTLGKAMEAKVSELNRATRRSPKMSAPARMANQLTPVSFADTKEVLWWGGGMDAPSVLTEFESTDTAVQVHAGHSHIAAVTKEKELFTWMVESSDEKATTGQLGHGDKERVTQPKKVEALQGIPIKMASCGKEFTACLTDSGTMYTFGSDYSGCLGCNQEEGEEIDSPLEVTFFHGKPVEQVSCGEKHILALTREKEIFSWGCGDKGCLGHGSEKSICLPTKVHVPAGKCITEVIAGSDGSFFLTADKKVLACGSNKDNKLGMNLLINGLRKKSSQAVLELAFQTSVTWVRPLARYAVCSISSGKTHSAAVTEKGLLLMFGQNKYGQLGSGDFKPKPGICEVKGPLALKQVEKVACGDGFTVVATKDFQVYSFGCTSRGRLGVSTDLSSSHRKRSAIPTPQPVFATHSHVIALSSCSSHTLAIMQKVTITSQGPVEQESQRKLSVTSQSSTDDDLHSVGSTHTPRSSRSNSLDYQGLSEHHPPNRTVNREPVRSVPADYKRAVYHPTGGVHLASTNDVVAPSWVPQQSPGDVTMVIPPPGTYRDGSSTKFIPIVSESQENPTPFPLQTGESVQQWNSQLHPVHSNSAASVLVGPTVPPKPFAVQLPSNNRSVHQPPFNAQTNAFQPVGSTTSASAAVTPMVQPYMYSFNDGVVGHSGSGYIPPSPRTKYPNHHSRPPEEGHWGSRKGGASPRKDHRLKEEEVRKIFERNRELEIENQKLRRVVSDLEKRNKELNQQINHVDNFCEEIWRSVVVWEKECFLTSF
ncbi:serine/threonine-protein kinase Nek9-like isoform X3 [Apostichopus japonicus]|uniref:serine/threonine-protein kinase Nek9-like isoform X3 n=1 Tax=Stichopus japonicus TaxID=307972 RepID=UPI003AB51F64